MIVIIGSQILKNDTILEDMVNRNQHRMGDGHVCTLWSAMSTDPHILRIKNGKTIQKGISHDMPFPLPYE